MGCWTIWLIIVAVWLACPIRPAACVPAVEVTWMEFFKPWCSLYICRAAFKQSGLRQTRSQPASHPRSAHAKWQRCLLSYEELRGVQIEQRKARRERARNNLWRYVSRYQRFCLDSASTCFLGARVALIPCGGFYFGYFSVLRVGLFSSSVSRKERLRHRGWRWITSSHPEGLAGSSGGFTSEETESVRLQPDTLHTAQPICCFSACLSEKLQGRFCYVLFELTKLIFQLSCRVSPTTCLQTGHECIVQFPFWGKVLIN